MSRPPKAQPSPELRSLRAQLVEARLQLREQQIVIATLRTELRRSQTTGIALADQDRLDAGLPLAEDSPLRGGASRFVCTTP